MCKQNSLSAGLMDLQCEQPLNRSPRLSRRSLTQTHESTLGKCGNRSEIKASEKTPACLDTAEEQLMFPYNWLAL